MLAFTLVAIALVPSLAPLGAATHAPVSTTAGSPAPCAPTDPLPAQLKRLGILKYSDEPAAGTWATWYVDPSSVPVASPPSTLSTSTATELAELHQLQANRTGDQVLKAKSYDGAPGKFWTELYLQLVIKHSDKNGIKNPPTLSRQIAMLHQAMYDALVVTWGAKYCHGRIPPPRLDPGITPIVSVPDAPSYPSEHAAVASAAAILMASFFPPGEEPAGTFDNLSAEIGESRLWGGANYRSDVDAGKAIGATAGQTVLAARANDGSTAVWDGSGQVFGTCNWVQQPPNFAGPLMPMWGHVSPFLMNSSSQFRPAPPPACDGTDYMAQSRDLYEASLTLTARQKEIAFRWAGGQGTVTPPGQWINVALNETAAHHLGTMRQARVMSYAGAALADAAIAAWDTKFTYWGDRPAMTIHRLWDANWTPLIATPPFPGYVSGHATFAGAVTVTLAHFFPEDRVQLSALAEEAAMSRFYGGIHIRADNEVGVATGERIGGLAGARATGDGAE